MGNICKESDEKTDLCHKAEKLLSEGITPGKLQQSPGLFSAKRAVLQLFCRLPIASCVDWLCEGHTPRFFPGLLSLYIQAQIPLLTQTL